MYIISNGLAEDPPEPRDCGVAELQKKAPKQLESLGRAQTAHPLRGRADAPALQAAFAFRLRGAGRTGAGLAGSGWAFSSNSSASFSVIAPPNSSASTIVTARL